MNRLAVSSDGVVKEDTLGSVENEPLVDGSYLSVKSIACCRLCLREAIFFNLERADRTPHAIFFDKPELVPPIGA